MIDVESFTLAGKTLEQTLIFGGFTYGILSLLTLVSIGAAVFSVVMSDSYPCKHYIYAPLAVVSITCLISLIEWINISDRSDAYWFHLDGFKLIALLLFSYVPMFIWITSKNIPGTIISFIAATIATVVVQYSMNAARELNLSGKGAIILIIITIAIILGGVIMAEFSSHEKRR